MTEPNSPQPTDRAMLAFERGRSAEQGGDLKAAAEAYLEAVEADETFAEAHHNLAGVLRRLSVTDHALIHARRAAELLPEDAKVRHALALTLELNGDRDAALAEIRTAQARDPFSPDIASNLGRLLTAEGMASEAIEILTPAAQSDPAHAGLRVNLGNAYLARGEPEAALVSFDEALALESTLAAALNGRGITNVMLRRFDDGLADFNAALDVAPEFAEAHENLAQELMRAGRWAEAWPELSWRWRNSGNRLTAPAYDIPEWDGTPLAGRTLLIHDEQGFGDSIQFFRFTQLIERDGGRLIVGCRAPLRRLYAGCAWIDGVVDQGQQPAEADCYISLLSLPRALDIRDITRNEAALFGGSTERYERQAAARVGITWRGSGKFPDNPYQDRDCALSHFMSLADIPDITLVSFQRDATPEEKTELTQRGVEIRDNGDFLDDLTALADVDLVVSVDTAFAHLSASANLPTWLVLPYAADWRWGRTGMDCMWYGSTRLFRQPAPGNWAPIFAQLAEDLTKIAGK